MGTTRRTLALLALGSALVARPALGQAGASVSLTHTVSVTVPPRVKVQVGTVAASAQQSARRINAKENALSVSVSATRSWILSIGEVGSSSDLEWSVDGKSFADVGSGNETVASGRISQVAAQSTLVFRSANALGGADRPSGEEAVLLTVVAP